MEKKDVILSVVVPVRNRAGVVLDTLDSIAGQTSGAFELIVVDNGSTDGTLSAVESWAEKQGNIPVRIATCAKPGAAAARNRGLELAAGAWVMFFDSDDIMLPRHIAKVAEAIEAHPEAEIIGWDVVMERIGGKRRKGAFFGRDMKRHNLFDGAMATQRWAARTALVRSVGAWDEAVGYWDDIELGSRMLERTDNVFYIGQGGVIVRESAESISSAGAKDPACIEPALTRMEKTIGARGRRWCRLKRAVEYALSSRAGSDAGKRLMHAMKPSPFLWMAYHYTRHGGRGIARLMCF